jgi:hypothetical protein
LCLSLKQWTDIFFNGVYPSAGGPWAGLHSVINVGSLKAGVAGMVYRDVNIALVNELANFAEVVVLTFAAARNCQYRR